MGALRILMVDDEATIRHVLRRVLGKQPCELREAGSGEEALTILEDWNPDLMISDISMPGMSGIQLLEQLKRRYPDTVVIMMTSYTSVEVIQQAIRGGAADFLSKPFALAEVWQTVERALGKTPAVAAASDSAPGD